MDTVDRRVAELVYSGAARAYGFRPVTGDGADEQLCVRCQWERPDAGHLVCATCEQEAAR
jgi:hypothetical protein